MQKIKKEEIKHIAKLANIKITEKEIEKYSKQLSSVVDYVGQLEEVETKNVIPTSQTTGLTNVKRQDKKELGNSLTVEESLSGTEDTYNGYFKVKAILEE
jgi:aspartyl-tRNA(Asn)/glutamyl-tRNA(Gln) amidotransferase subunit C